MKKKMLFIIVFVVFFSFKHNVLALDAACTQEEQLRLRQVAAATTVQYKLAIYEMGNGFQVYVYGVTNELSVKHTEGNNAFTPKEGNIAVGNGFLPGQSGTIDFYATDVTKCSGLKLMSKSISIPYYNYYSTDPLCKGLEDYYLCQTYSNVQSVVTSYEDFVTRITAYKKSLEEKPDGDGDEKPKPTPKTFWDNVLDFVQAYYFYFLIVIIVSGTTAIVVIEVKKRRSIL